MPVAAYRPAGCRLPGTAALVALAATPALAALDPVTDRQVGGVLSNACGDRSQVMIRLYDDTLDVERAGVAVKASKLRASRSAPSGAPVVPDFAASVQGQAKSGPVNLTITHGAKGLFARIDGSEAALAPLGPGVVGQVLRHCDPNRNRLAGAPIPLEEQTIGALLKRPGFPAAYRAALGPLAREPWIASASGPSPNLRQVDVGGQRYWLAAVCKPHDCADHNLVLLWDEPGARVQGLVHQKARDTQIGDPPPAVAAELKTLWAKEWQQR
ncbi:MAG: Ivy family c-type lysozyme inhibitor [Rubrivivax sp.]